MLFGTDAAPATIATMVTSHLFSLATTQAHGDAHMLPPEPWINVGEVEMSAVEHIDFEITSADLYPHPTLVGITELNVVDSDTAGDQYDITAEFNLVLLGDVDVSGYTLDNDGHVQMSSTTATQMIVVVPFIADIEDHHVGLTVNGSAEASPATIRTRDPLDGIEHAASWLSDLVGITFPYDADLHQEFTLSGLNGNSSQVYLSSDWEEPTLHVDLGGQEVVIASRYDVGSRVWDGKEGFDLYPPYYLSSSVDGLSEEAFTSLSQIWEYLVSPAATDS
ncbi:hypothetical protein [Nocardioides sp. L-11A]|uniref:hypothetical protein n=1 Tax=Nocardioides sp. L-11A TaxID=3043848 RepID=UPI00249C22FC|nr:hypothetical protein QJ852_00075 [Nocardioides sp. L-11A]